ncbi:MAG: hypothetical protein SV686_16825 [Thermodesulfobacteriota bacterium]|jgi:hypothetical protein|nr:hypothetical protein [Thermodesulfobacteriota bacterium]
MKTDRDSMKEQLKCLEERIQELEERLPAHSTKPSMMAELCALEDERDALFFALLNGEKKNN